MVPSKAAWKLEKAMSYREWVSSAATFSMVFNSEDMGKSICMLFRLLPWLGIEGIGVEDKIWTYSKARPRSMLPFIVLPNICFGFTDSLSACSNLSQAWGKEQVDFNSKLSLEFYSDGLGKEKHSRLLKMALRHSCTLFFFTAILLVDLKQFSNIAAGVVGL